MDRTTVRSLRAEVKELRLRLEEAESALEAIRTGQVDSIVVDGQDGPRIFSLEGANHSYRILVEAMNEGAATFTADGTILYCNARFARMLGAPLHEVMGSSIQVSLPEHAKSSFASLLQSATTGESRGEVALQTRSGKEVVAHFSVSALEDAGRVVFCVVATDLTRQKQELDKILSSMSESLLVFDARACVIKTNAAARRLLGFDPVRRDIAGLARRMTITSPDGRRLRADELPAARALRGETVTNLRLVLRTHGRRLAFIVSSLPVQQGELITGAVSVWHDITEFERSQTALRESEARLSSVLGHSLDCVYRYDVQKQSFDYVSPASQRIVGFSPEELMAQDAEEADAMVHPDDRAAMRAALARLEETGEVEVEYRQQTKDGGYCWISNHISLTRDETDRPLYRNGIIRDVTDRKRSEEALRDAHEQLRLVQDAASAGAWDWRIASGDLLWSAQCKALFGFPADAHVTIEKFLAAVHPEDRPRVEDSMRRALEYREPYEVEMRVRWPNGSTHWNRSIGRAYFASSGKPNRMAGLMLDITKIKEAQQALHESESRYRALFENLPDAAFLTIPSGAILSANPAAQKMFHMTEEEIIRTGREGLVDTADAGYQTAIQERARTGQYSDREMIHIRKGGERFETEVSSVVLPGGPLNAFVVIRDVTERKRAERALRDSESRLRRLWDSGIIGVLHFDLEGSIADANDKFLGMVGYSHAALDAGLMDWSDMTAPEYRAIDAQAVAELRSGSVATPYEKEFICKDGSRVWVLIGGAMFDDESRRGIGFVVDITERKRAEEALRKANEQLVEMDRCKNEFLAVLSHELRNPLAPIRNSVYIMGHSAPGGEQARRAQTVIDRQVTHLARLIDDLLDVTRISRGKIRLQRESLDLNEIVRGTGEDMREVFRRNGIELKIEIPAQSLRVRGDRIRIAQVVGNLLQNATKFTPRGGRTTLSLETNADCEAEIRVHDTGVGLAPGLLDKLFQPFMQADQTLDRSIGGLGLGLALVRGLVEHHGGTVSAASEGPGKGALFTVRLPLESEKWCLVGEVKPPATARPLSVLVIEDNEDAATSLKEVLELSGHTVAIALTGPEGVQMARTALPEVVLCDIGLPELDGYGVAKSLRADARACQTFLVALSGYAAPEDVQRSREAGFDEHLAKPPSFQALESLLARAPRRPRGPYELGGPALASVQ